MEFDRKDINMNKLVATSLEGKFHIFDMRTQHVTKGFASVSEKVLDTGGDSKMYVWGKNVKIVSLLLFCVSLTVFTAGSVWSCLFNILCGFVTLAKGDTGLRRRKKCAWIFCLTVTVKSTMMHRLTCQVFLRSASLV